MLAYLQVKPSIQATQSQSIMIVSPASGQGTSQILKISHPPTASAEQLQSLAQTLITGKSADGSVVQLRSTQPAKSIATTSASGNITISNMQNLKITQPTLKRTTQNVQQGRNVRYCVKFVIFMNKSIVRQQISFLMIKISRNLKINYLLINLAGIHKNDIDRKSAAAWYSSSSHYKFPK